MPCPDPAALRAGNRSGREEFVQLLLAILVVGGNAPRWNAAATPTARGRKFLNGVLALSGLRVFPEDSTVTFVNEFELPRRHDGEVSGWPDFAVLTAHRLVMIELKTEPRSHRRGQLAHYADLAAFRHPELERDLIYITPQLSSSATLDSVPFSHIAWSDVASLVISIWSEAPSDEQRIATHVVDILDRLGERWVPSSGDVTGPMAASDDALIGIADAVAADGQQRAANVAWSDPEDMERARVEIRDALIGRDSSVRPWIWNADTSGGTALTAAGRSTGYELRFSRYRDKA